MSETSTACPDQSQCTMDQPSDRTTSMTTPTSTPSHTSTMEEELNHIRTLFDGQCKVIDTEGKFVKTVKLHPTDLDIVFNFKVTGML